MCGAGRSVSPRRSWPQSLGSVGERPGHRLVARGPRTLHPAPRPRPTPQPASPPPLAPTETPLVKIDPAARPFTALAAVPTVVAALARRPRTTAALGLLTAGVTLFFRDPDRTPDRSPVSDPDVVLAPADGIVMHVGEPQPGIAPPGEWQQVSIFLSLLDVHMNRSPYGGRVIDVTHTPGRFLAAYPARSAPPDERRESILPRGVAGRGR